MVFYVKLKEQKIDQLSYVMHIRPIFDERAASGLHTGLFCLITYFSLQTPNLHYERVLGHEHGDQLESKNEYITANVRVLGSSNKLQDGR